MEGRKACQITSPELLSMPYSWGGEGEGRKEGREGGGEGRGEGRGGEGREGAEVGGDTEGGRRLLRGSYGG